MVARWLLALIWVAGCDQTWGLVHVAPSPDGGSDTDGACPASYTIEVTGSTSLYRHARLNLRWDLAEQRCEMDRGASTRNTHLVVLTDESERLGLYSKIDLPMVTNDLWIGFSDRRLENLFQWVTAEPIGAPPNMQTPPWATDQPDNNMTLGGQDCVRMIVPPEAAESLFDDSECAAGFDFICECDDWEPIPTSF